MTKNVNLEFIVTCKHKVEKYRRTDLRVSCRVDRQGDGEPDRYYVAIDGFGCSKSYARPADAIIGMLTEHACFDINVRSTLREIEFMDHRKFRIGDRIEFATINRDFIGTIFEITEDGKCKVNPEGDLTHMHNMDRWPLRGGDGWFVKCRDHGVPGGSILKKVSRPPVEVHSRAYWTEQARYWRSQGDSQYAERCEAAMAQWGDR